LYWVAFTLLKTKSLKKLPQKYFANTSQSLYPPGSEPWSPGQSLVEKGAVVKVGQLIGKGEAFISANVHSSVSGKVLKVDDVIDQSGYKRKAIFIDVAGDEWDESIDRSDTIIRDCHLSPEEITQKIKDMGVVGLGGATFPTHVKLMVPTGKKADCLIINGVECEPYLDFRPPPHARKR
jgi:Na+-translocating ferredoxin:NAD+ oxidoreductase subunit C